MTIHEMLLQVSLFSSGTYERRGAMSSIRVPLPDGRSQVIYGRNETVDRDTYGLLYTKVGPKSPDIDPWDLLALNVRLKRTRAALHNGQIILLSYFEMRNTSIMECAPILQEMAAVADELERRYFLVDDA